MANTYKALSTVTVGAGGAATISFTNIPQTYTDLLILFSGRTDNVNESRAVKMTLNSNTNNKSSKVLYGTNTTAGVASYASEIWVVDGVSGATTASGTFGNYTAYIPNYVSSNSKSVSIDATPEGNYANVTIGISAGLWSNSSPITSITLQPEAGNLVQYSTATLYGVFNADVSSAPATPTIGTATAGASSASITFTPVSNAASYTMTSTPSSITGTGTTSPITVSGLTNGTAYTFKVKSNNPFGSSAESAASNSVTPAIGASYDSISTVTLGSSSSNINITSIPSTYTHLQLRGQYSFTNNGGTPRFRLGTGGSVDSGLKYNYNEFYANSSGVSSWTGYNNDSSFLGYGGEITSQCAFVLDIFDYANSNKRKSYKWTIMAGVGAVYYGVGFFDATAAITNINMFGQVGSFQTGSKFALYGIKG